MVKFGVPTWNGLSAVKKHLYLVLGIEAVRGAARLTLTNLGSILAGPASTKAATARRRNARLKYRQAASIGQRIATLMLWEALS